VLLPAPFGPVTGFAGRHREIDGIDRDQAL
jgi:hypothetical protein